MKKMYAFVFTLFAFGYAHTLQAQIGKGASLVGGGIYFSSQNSSSSFLPRENKVSQITVNPSYGKAIRQNLIAGVDLSYSNYNNTASESSVEQTQTQNDYGLGIFMRQYKNLGKSGFYLFLQSRVGGSIKTGEGKYDLNNSTIDTEIKGFGARLNFYPGIAYSITPKFQIETGLNNLFYVDYSSTTTSSQQPDGNTSKTSGFGAGISVGENVQWSVGFRLLLGD